MTSLEFRILSRSLTIRYEKYNLKIEVEYRPDAMLYVIGSRIDILDEKYYLAINIWPDDRMEEATGAALEEIQEWIDMLVEPFEPSF